MARLLWSQRQDIGPPPRYGAGMAYDEARQQTILCGNGSADMIDTWAWDGDSWVQLADTGPRQIEGRLTYDRARQRVVALTGGTWEWDGAAWTQVADTGPSGPIAYDAARQRVVTVTAGAGPRLETWEWDGATWTQVADQGPTTRSGFAIAFDEERGRLVLFGGLGVANLTTPGLALADTWTWDGQRWEEAANMGPSARIYHALAFDAARPQVVLFGGQQGISGARNNDTWLWNGARWSQLENMGPPARTYQAMTYDRDRDRVVLFGGLTLGRVFGDTWELGPYA